MEPVRLIEAARHTSPNPVSLVCTRAPDGVTNLATISWWTYLGLTPPTLGFAMMKPSYSGELVRATKEAVLTIPGEPLARQVMECGSTSGRAKDKAAAFGVEMTPLPGTEIEIPRHSVVAIHCVLRETVDVGDHWFYVCDADAVFADNTERAVFAWQGYARIAPAREG